jgi:hypothetical protein
VILQPYIVDVIVTVIVTEFDKEWTSDLNVRLCCEAFDGLERFTYIPVLVKSEKDEGKEGRKEGRKKERDCRELTNGM